MSIVSSKFTGTLSLKAIKSRSDQLKVRQLEVRNAYLEKEIMQLRRSEAEARYLSNHDSLTGMPNRHLFLDRFNQAQYLADRHQQILALIFLDLDGFKSINDGLGHAVGDALLHAISRRLTSVMRISDSVCRYGGDEFLILLSEVKDRCNANRITEKICQVMNEEYFIESHKIVITASSGLALYPDDCETYDELFKFADHVMYRKKTEGRVIPKIQRVSSTNLEVVVPY